VTSSTKLLDAPLFGGLAKDVIGGSIAKTKRRGNKGSRCLSPLPCFIGSLPMPLRSTPEEEEDRRATIQSRNLLGKPKC
jgi:hypothetical protein